MQQELTPAEIEALKKVMGETTHTSTNSALSTQRRPALPPHISHAQFPPFPHETSHQHPFSAEAVNALQDVKVEVQAILGKTKLSLRQLLELKQGSLIQLDKLAGELVELIDENGKVIARGEVVVVEDNYGIQIH